MAKFVRSLVDGVRLRWVLQGVPQHVSGDVGGWDYRFGPVFLLVSTWVMDNLQNTDTSSVHVRIVHKTRADVTRLAGCSPLEVTAGYSEVPERMPILRSTALFFFLITTGHSGPMKWGNAYRGI